MIKYHNDHMNRVGHKFPQCTKDIYTSWIADQSDEVDEWPEDDRPLVLPAPLDKDNNNVLELGHIPKPSGGDWWIKDRLRKRKPAKG